MAELYKNLSRSTLAGPITAGGATLTVQAGDGNLLFPLTTAPDFFKVFLFDKTTGNVEICKVTSRPSGDILTITRAYEEIGNVTPAVAYAFPAGSLVELRPSAEFFTNLEAGATSLNIQQGLFVYGIDSGAADAYVVAMTPSPAASPAGLELRVLIAAGNTNTGIAATLQMPALGNRNIKMEDGSNPPAGTIKAGVIHTFVDNGSNYIFKPSGLAATATGFHALNNQINFVAAGTALNDVATIGGNETLLNKTLITPSMTSPQVNGFRNYAFVPLSAPVPLFTSAVIDTDTLMDMTAVYATAETAGAQMAIILIELESSSVAGLVETEFYAHHSAPGTNAVYRKLLNYNKDALNAVESKNNIEITVMLDNNSDFYWRHQVISGSTHSAKVHLIGYYV